MFYTYKIDGEKKEADEEPLNIADVRSNRSQLERYIKMLSSFMVSTNDCNQFTLFEYARKNCVGLPTEQEVRTKFDTTKGQKDKGLFGKVVEYGLFGQKPNSDAAPDLLCGLDIKSCVFKKLKKGGKNAKERQTLTNCGNTKDYSTFSKYC